MEPNLNVFFVQRKFALWSIIAILALFVASILITYFASSATTKNCKINNRNPKKTFEDSTCTNLLCNNPLKSNGNKIFVKIFF